MSEDYNWVNVDRREYICPGDFDYRHWIGRKGKYFDPVLYAVKELLSNEWKGDHIFYMGDGKLIPKDSGNDTLQMLYEHTVQIGYSEDGFDTICESYKNVSGLFQAAEDAVREWIEGYLEECRNGGPTVYNEYGIDIANPYDGLFLRSGRDFGYTINHTKRVYYSLEETRILWTNNKEADFDPLYELMGYGKRIPETGPWMGDVIGVSDDRPAGYHLLKEIYVDW